ncbi:hypothetical protein IMSAGC018_01058 [Lachnospiraceae bacterium]|nr:hypothetical protein IMSAGC018_01058 [Lachnospiraceae bacterium]
MDKMNIIPTTVLKKIIPIKLTVINKGYAYCG